MIVVIPFNLPWEWSTDYTNQTAFALSKKHTVVCYMWCDFMSIKEYLLKKKVPILVKRYSKNIFLFYPILFIPFRRYKTVVKVNEKLNIFLLKTLVYLLCVIKKYHKKAIWLFDPRTEPLVHYFKNNWRVVYDCVDYFIGTGIGREEKKTLAEAEIKLSKESDLVVANSLVLKRHLEKIRKDIILAPQGFRIDTFDEYVENKYLPKLKRDKRTLIGFVGAVNYRIDYELIYNLACKNKGWDFAIWGPELQLDLLSKKQKHYYNKLLLLPNLIFGKSEKSEIPGIIKQFDIGMIPYLPNDDFNKYCYPMKLFEFFYVGIPVVSTEIEELKRFPDLVKMGNSATDWERIIQVFISYSWPSEKKLKQRRLAFDNSWAEKVKVIVKHLNLDWI